MVLCKREVGSRPIALNMNEVLYSNGRLRKSVYTVHQEFWGARNSVYFLKKPNFLRKYKTFYDRELFSAIGRELISRLQKDSGQQIQQGARAFAAKSNNRIPKLSTGFALNEGFIEHFSSDFLLYPDRN